MCTNKLFFLELNAGLFLYWNILLHGQDFNTYILFEYLSDNGNNIKVFAFHCFQEGKGRWLNLDQELVIHNGEIVGTRFATDHSVLLDARFELPYGELN